MNVEVKDLLAVADGAHHVLVRTPAGTATLPLRTPATQVVPGRPCTAELSVDISLIAGENALPSPEQSYRIGSDGEVVTLVGVVDGIDPDGLVYFRLGPDILVMIESEPHQFAPGDWLRIVAPLSRTGIYLTF